MKNETSSFKGWEDTKLFYQSWSPDSGNIKAYIVTIHAFGMHSDFLKIPAENLTEKGYALYAFDLRGHWRNKGASSGHIESVDHLVKDTNFFLEVIKEIARDRKIFLMGDSFGGLLTLKYAMNRPAFAGVIVVSPLFDFSFNKEFGKKVKTGSYNIDHKELISDLKILKLFHTEKNLTKNISAKSVSDMNSLLKEITKNPQSILCPILFLQAGQDKFCDVKGAKKYFNKIKSQDKILKVYEDQFHELLFDRNRAHAYQDIFIWLEKHIK